MTLYAIQVKRGKAADWTATTYRLRSGEFGYEEDTGKFKLGNGIDSWSALPYYIDEDGVAELIAASGGSGSDPRIGTMTDLTTVEQTTVVGAINEINTPLVALDLLYENAKAG